LKRVWTKVSYTDREVATRQGLRDELAARLADIYALTDAHVESWPSDLTRADTYRRCRHGWRR
jgi:hypothetical protein